MMILRRFVLLCATFAAMLPAQIPPPSFTRESVLPAGDSHPQSLMPGDLVSIYGHDLAPEQGCQPPPMFNNIYPTRLCEVTVTLNGIPAGSLAVLKSQINLQVPKGVPTSGEAAIVVTVSGVSSPPVMVPFGKPKAILWAAGPLYVHMPAWISIQRPRPYDVAYPYALNPGSFGGCKLEVRHNGVLMKPLEIRQSRNQDFSGLVNGSIAPSDSPRGRLPLHLQYRFDVPGTYEVRFVATQTRPERTGLRQVQVDESDWTPFEILRYSDTQRRAWIREQIAEMPSSPGLLVGDAIPSLLALPDELALRAILPELYHSSGLVRGYVAASVLMFDDALVRKELTPLVIEKGPTPEITRLLDEDENRFEGGHQAILRLFPRFLNSSDPLVRTGSLQYLIWGQNHDWGKTQQFATLKSTLVFAAAADILDHGDAGSQQMLSEALGTVKSDASRDLLWKMISKGIAEEQSMIALTWIGNSRDLPRLAAFLLNDVPSDPDGQIRASLPYSLHHAYGDASLPWLKQAGRESKVFFVRVGCARELIIANQVEGFEDLQRAIHDRPSFKREAAQFLRDRFPELVGASEPDVLVFLAKKAREQ